MTNQLQLINLKFSRPKQSENVKIDVISTEALAQLTYQVLSQGNVVLSETVKVPNSKTFQIEFKATLAMVPNANVIVYYITSDGEIISDSLVLEFENEMKNFVSCCNFSFLKCGLKFTITDQR